MEIKCPECGFAREVPEEKIPPTAKMATCPKCGQKFSFREDHNQAVEGRDEPSAGGEDFESPETDDKEKQSSEEDIWSQLESLSDAGPEKEEREGQKKAWQERGQRTGTRGGTPWENLMDYGFFPGFIETIKQVMFQPQAFFARMPIGQGYSKPLIFSLIISEIQILAIFMWRIAGIASVMDQGGVDFWGLGLASAGVFFILLLYPLVQAGGLFLESGIIHACLMAFKRGGRGYEATFRVVSYAKAPTILGVIPLLGPTIGVLWAIRSIFLGLKYTHKIDNLITLVAIIPLLCIQLLMIIFVFSQAVG